jgi:hypothetical protein
VAVLDAGDCPDPRFVQRHLEAHRFGTLPMITAADLRLLDRHGAVLHAGVMGLAAGWGRQAPPIVPPFGHGLRDWPLAPLAACVLRRSPALDAFFGGPLDLGEREVDWLLMHYALVLGGGTRLAENLLDLCLPPGATANASALSPFVDRHGAWVAPDAMRAVAALLTVWLRTPAAVRAWFAPAWEQRFVRWLAQAAGAPPVVEWLRRQPQRDEVVRLSAVLAAPGRPA